MVVGAAIGWWTTGTVLVAAGVVVAGIALTVGRSRILPTARLPEDRSQ